MLASQSRTRKANPVLAVTFLLLLVSFLSACQKNNSFLSNAKLEKKLEGTWHMVPLFASDPSTLDWIFEPGGKLTLINSADTNFLEHGSWSSSAHLVGSKLVIGSLRDSMLNGKWEIVNIQNDLLQISIPYKNCGDQSHCGSLMRDFYR